MRLKALICCVILVLATGTAMAQAPGTEKLNQRDAKGRQHGPWYSLQPARMGEPSFSEFGSYDHGRKTGVWYRFDGESQLVSVEHYRNNVLDGEVKYFEAGQLTCIGHYRGLNPSQEYDTIIVTHPITGLEQLVPVRSDRGSLRHGLWRYYDAQTGRLIREEEYQVDDLVYQKSFALTKDDSLYYRKRSDALPHNRQPNARNRRVQNSNIGY